MADDLADEVFDIGDGEDTFSLADLANINMDEVKEVHGGKLPKMRGKFRVEKMELTSRETANGKRPAVSGEFTVVDAFSCMDDEVDLDSLVGRKHYQTWFFGAGKDVKDLQAKIAEDIGRWKGFLANTGIQASGSLQSVCEQTVGHEFTSAIAHRKDKTDPDKVYSGFDDDKTKPIEVSTEAAA